MKTEFAKAFEKRDLKVGDEIVCVSTDFWEDDIQLNSVHTITKLTFEFDNYTVWTDTGFSLRCSVGDFEFKHILDKQKESEPVMRSYNYDHSAVVAQYYDSLTSIKEQLEGALEINKQYEQQIHMLKDDLFNLQMENARLELAAQRWEMFNCEANRNIADKLLKKLADEAIETYN